MPKEIPARKSGIVDLRKKFPVQKSAPAKAVGSSFSRPKARSGFSATRPRPVKRGGGLLTFLIILLVLLVAAALASFFLFDSAKTGHSLKMTLTAPKSISSGEEVALEITYENLDKIALEKMEVVVQYPGGFYYNSSSLEPYNQEQNQWQLADLAVGQSGTLSVKGQLVGKIKEEKEFTVVFHYVPANFNSDFRETISKKIKISDALLDVALEAPAKIEDGQEIGFKVGYQNKQAEAMSEVYFAFELAEGFSATYLSPTTTDYLWLVPEIAANQESSFEVRGLADSSLVNPFPWSFRVWQMSGPAGSSKERILYQQSGEIEILAPQLEVKVELVKADRKLNWGEEADFKISYKNSGQLDVKEAVLRLALNGLIDWSRYNNLTGATRDNNTLIWLSKSSSAAAGLSALPVGKEGELVVTVPLISEPDDLSQLSAEELMVEAQASISVRFNEADKVFTSEVLSEPVASEARLQTEARHYLDSSTQVGSGPLPPEIGQQTDYRIYWKVFTGSKALSDLKIKTSLPAYISWIGEADSPTLGSSLAFDESSRQVTWEIAEVSGNTQLLASFDLSVIPTDSQVNQLLILTNPTSFTAEVMETKTLVSKTADLLTSDLIGDPVAQGKGRVKVGN